MKAEKRVTPAAEIAWEALQPRTLADVLSFCAEHVAPGAIYEAEAIVAAAEEYPDECEFQDEHLSVEELRDELATAEADLDDESARADEAEADAAEARLDCEAAERRLEEFRQALNRAAAALGAGIGEAVGRAAAEAFAEVSRGRDHP